VTGLLIVALFIASPAVSVQDEPGTSPDGLRSTSGATPLPTVMRA
jgi:hypothetical protein